MRRDRFIHLAAIAGIVGLMAGGVALAQGQPRATVAEDQARSAALAAFPGMVIETELDRYSGRDAYEFKVRPQNGGPATDVHVDAHTGVVLGTGEDNEPESDTELITRVLGRQPAVQTASRAVRAPADQIFQDDFDLPNRALSDTGEGRYFVLRPGFRTVLSDGESQLTITVLDQTRDVGGTMTRVVEERLETDGVPEEIAMNYFAIDATTGDAFYFGEDVDVFKDGVLTGHPGAWLATGENRPGMIMPGNPVVGMRFYQEVAPEVAMDRAEVLSTSETCQTPAGDFSACVITRETSAIETGEELKYFAPGIGLVQDGELRLISYGYVDPESH